MLPVCYLIRQYCRPAVRRRLRASPGVDRRHSKNLRSRRYRHKFWASMHKLLKKLLSLWVIWSIALLPLQSFGALSAPAASEPCTMQPAATRHQHAGGHDGHHDTGQSLCPTCRLCQQHDCDGDDCAAGGCSGLQLPPAMLPLRLVELQPGLLGGDALPPSGIASRTDPPPLPPPD